MENFEKITQYCFWKKPTNRWKSSWNQRSIERTL